MLLIRSIIIFLDTPLKIVQKIPQPTMCTGSNILNPQTVISSFFLSPVTSDEVEFILKHKLKNTWSVGPDEFPLAIIKKIWKYILKPLVYLINLSFNKGTSP